MDAHAFAAPPPLSRLFLQFLVGLALAALLIFLPLGASRKVVVLDNLDNPRGITVDSSGGLYVAETGHRQSGGRVLHMSPSGHVDVRAQGLPVLVHGSDEEVGASDVALCTGTTYLVLGEGADPRSSALLRVEPDGNTVKVADLLAYEERYNPDGASRESNPFAAVCDSASGDLFVSDSAANDVLRVSSTGTISIAAVWRDDPVPTGLAIASDGSVFVALLGPWPYTSGTGRIDQITANGAIRTAVPGLTMPIGVVFDSQGRLIVTEFASEWNSTAFHFVAGGGRLLRVRSNGSRDMLADHLDFPTSTTMAPDGSFYVTEWGAFGAPHAGRVLRIRAPASST
jgi:sugar lactone lactonase YvrE